MNLRLNPAHTLCLPSRNLVFATFGTGAGGQVLDLSVNRQHGIRQARVFERTLTTTNIPSAPSDASVLALRDGVSGVSAVRFTAPATTALVDRFTAAVWVRPWQVSTFQAPFLSGDDGVGGWKMFSSSDSGFGNCRLLALFSSGSVTIIQTNTVLPLGQWSLIAFSRDSSASPRQVLYYNGRVDAATSTPSNSNPSVPAAQSLWLGGINGDASFENRCDIGPAFVWGSVLSADDMALLYRDTWGMVTRVGTSMASRVSASATTTTTTTTTESGSTTACYQGRTRFGLFSYLPGCGAIQWRNSRFKRESQ